MDQHRPPSATPTDPRSGAAPGAHTVRAFCGHDCPDGCSLLVQVEGQRVTRIKGDPANSFTDGFICAKVNRDPELLASADRLLTPLRRSGRKGSGQFVPISWDEALDTIAARWQAIIREDGPLALLGYAYSAHQGQVNRGLVNGLFHALGSSRLAAGTVCDSCCETAWDLTVGPVGGPDPESIDDADLIIGWSSDLVATNVHLWSRIERARKRGVPFIAIDPRRHMAAARADWHIPIRIGTDGALALGIMHVMVRDGLCDLDYLQAHTAGFEALRDTVLPDYPPEFVARHTGVAVADIERLAAMIGRSRRTFLRLGEGMTRSLQGGQTLRAVAMLPAFNGSYGRRGGGAFLLAAASFDFDYAAIRKPSGPATTRTINHLRLGEDLLTLKDPPIRALFVAANNPAVTCPETGKVRAGLAREDLFTVVHDPFMTATARYADIVLPAALYLETDDFYRSYGNYWMQYAAAAVAPPGEARSNHFVAQALAQRMGLTDPAFTMSARELAEALFEGAGPTLRAQRGRALDEGVPVKLPPPDAQPFATPSGKLEIWSQTLADSGLDPLPRWHPEGPEQLDGRPLPLRLLTTPGHYLSHTSFRAVADLTRREGPPCCVLHPDDASARALADGQQVRLFNSRGEVRLPLRISDEIPAGIALVPGQREDSGDRAVTINLLCGDRYTDIGEGATYQSTWLEVAPIS